MTDGQKRRKLNYLTSLLEKGYKTRRSFKRVEKIQLLQKQTQGIKHQIDSIYKSYGKYVWQGGTYIRAVHGELNQK